MELKTVESLFHIAGIEILSTHKLANQYYLNPQSDSLLEWCRDNPWWLVETIYGLIVLGPRRRVYELRWERTALRKIITEDDVTKDDTLVHAYGVPKLQEYLTTLAFELKMNNAYRGIAPV